MAESNEAKRRREEYEERMIYHREAAAQFQWGKNQEDKPKYCLPKPVDSICGLNILLSAVWIIIAVLLISAFNRRNAMRRKPKKENKSSERSETMTKTKDTEKLANSASVTTEQAKKQEVKQRKAVVNDSESEAKSLSNPKKT